MNFLAKADSFEDGSTESPSAPWGPDAMQWSIFQRGGVFDYDIASAWRALECTKMDANKVHMAIIDVGFQQWGPEWDLPLPFKYSTKAFARNDDDEGKKPWHGIHVTQAAAGLADNRMGAAGPAGPVAQVSLIHNPRTEDGLIHAVSMARDMGARIINISWHSTVSAGLWGDDPDGLEDLTRDMWNKGFLLFASPGNDGENIDSVDDDGDEEYWYWPCENQGVICVGGLSGTAPVLHPSSNYSEGRGEFVDIWAPYEVLGGPDPDHRGNVARRMQGTSYSSPFAAGVAALIWAANPKLSNKQVWDLMSKHARGAPGLPRVNAYGPVREALKSVTDKRNVCPDEMIPNSDVTIHLSQGSVHILPCSVKFLDAGDCCSVTWTSSIEGTLGQGSSIYAVFDTHRPGPRVVTMTATDNKGHWESRQFTVTLVPPPPKAPTVEVAEPQSPIVLVGLGTAFVAKVNDDEHVEQDKCVWVSDRPGEGPWKGCRTAMQFTAAGTPTLTVTYTDAQGLSGSASMQLSVVEPTKGSNLKVNLVLEHLINEQWSKQDVASFGNARLRAYLIDTEGPGEADLSQYTFQWEVEHAGRKTVPDRFLGRSNQVLVVYDKVFVPGWVWSCGEQTFKVTVTVAHAKGEVSREAKAQLSYTLNLPACIK